MRLITVLLSGRPWAWDDDDEDCWRLETWLLRPFELDDAPVDLLFPKHGHMPLLCGRLWFAAMYLCA